MKRSLVLAVLVLAAAAAANAAQAPRDYSATAFSVLPPGNYGGVDFNQTERPDYRDFVYFALTLGMTFQVSDTTITSKTVRRQATRHALLSYLFGAVIVALAINTVASLLQ